MQSASLIKLSRKGERKVIKPSTYAAPSQFQHDNVNKILKAIRLTQAGRLKWLKRLLFLSKSSSRRETSFLKSG